jgi:hypothetical protein
VIAGERKNDARAATSTTIAQERLKGSCCVISCPNDADASRISAICMAVVRDRAAPMNRPPPARSVKAHENAQRHRQLSLSR